MLEFVEGPTLAERIAQGRLPLDEALAIARQIVEAVEAAPLRSPAELTKPIDRFTICR